MKPRIVEVFPSWWPFLATTIGPFIFIKKGRTLTPNQLQHEKIHMVQQQELLYLFFFIIYLVEFVCRSFTSISLIRGYREISFEKEAHFYEDSLWENLIEERKTLNWSNIFWQDFRTWMRKYWHWPAFVVLMYFYIQNVDEFRSWNAEYTEDDYNEPISQRRVDTIEITKLDSLFKGNEIRAESNFKGRRFYIQGIAKKIEKGVFGDLYGKFLYQDIEYKASFPEIRKMQLSNLDPGEIVGMTCTCQGLEMWYLKFDNCEITAKYKN